MSNKNHDHKDILGHSDQLNQQAPQDLSRKDKSLTAQAIDESRRITRDPSEPSYSTIQSLREALDQ
ncbi:hypothetical protein MK526_06345 [Abiotrophia defectiva]|uniref:hypothetical protein n=1 Tax=Abiotrophia defectiva TaxID=46125 RepID=UPI002282E9AF|nr:hypothetical protein [Abiotrophia defectiva]MCY7225367.1 hypothetical protein [Abiotrophia defectiva]